MSDIKDNIQVYEVDQKSQDIKNKYSPAYYVMWGFIGISLLLNIIGVIVQYTSLGDITDKQNNIQVQFSEKDGKGLYIDLLIQIDKLLLNRKRIWAIFFLCHSFTRNATILFYDTEKCRKVDYMRLIKVIGFFWVAFYITLYVAFESYPVNFNEYPYFLTNIYSMLLISGTIFGFGMLHFYAGFSVMYEKLTLIYVRQ